MKSVFFSQYSQACKVGGAACLSIFLFAKEPAAQTRTDDVANQAWQAGAITHARKMRILSDKGQAQQPTPAVIPKYSLDLDPSGQIGTYQRNGATLTSSNPFFQNLGTNGRTCFTCHQPKDGWSVSAISAKARYYASNGTDPLFRLVDGATCPTADVSTPHAKLRAYSLLLNKALVRVGLPFPKDAEFSVVSIHDPYHCNTNPVTGLSNPSEGTISVYRRILPSTNLRFLNSIMADGREPSLTSQATDATLTHAEATAAPTKEQLAQIVDFETGLSTAQARGKDGNALDSRDVKGGPIQLSREPFFIGINDPLSSYFSSTIFKLYEAWEGFLGSGRLSRHQEAVARGETVFNDMRFNIAGVAGLNDTLDQEVIRNSSCGTCHDTPNVGNHSVSLPINIGIANAGADSPPHLDISGLPVFTLQCNSGPLARHTYMVTDPGRALISGKCEDIGKFKGPVLRGLAARAPYFHNGSAMTLMDVINFYDTRFNIGFSREQKEDLVDFLNSL